MRTCAPLRGQRLMMTTLTTLEKMLDGPRDSALLRFGLGREYMKAGKTNLAITMFESAIARNPAYSAAWKALGQAQAAEGQTIEARSSFEQGIAVAESHGDIQAAKEMKVFLRRIDRAKIEP